MTKAALRKAEIEPDRYVPYTRHVNDTVVALRSGEIMTVIKLDGVSFETADIEDINRLHLNLNSMWQNQADERLAVWSHIVRRRERSYPRGEFRSDFSHHLNEKYRERLVGEELYRNDLYLTVLWRPHRGVASKSFAKLFKSNDSKIDTLNDSVEKLERAVKNLSAALNSYGPQVLTLEERDGIFFSQPAEFLHLIISGEELSIPLVQGNLASALYTNRVIFGSETIEIRSPGRTRLAGMFGIKEYPSRTRPGMLNTLLQAPFEFTLTQSFDFMAQADGLSLLTRKQNQMISAQDKGVSQLEELYLAEDDLISNKMVMGVHHLVLLVYGENRKGLLENMAAAQMRLSNGGAVVAREDLGLEASFWSQLPGNFGYRARSGAITSLNFTAMVPFHGYPQGRADQNHWGPAVTLLKTTAGSPYFFNFHSGDLGNTLMVGPSGSGKTVALNFFLAQLEKHNPRMVFFDKDRGADLFIRAAGGSYLPLRNGKPTGCAPFKALDLTPDNIVFLSRFVRKLVQVEGKPLKVQELAAIDRAILALRDLPKEQRSLMSFSAHLDMTDAEGIHARLQRWTREGALGWVFDGEADLISFDARLVGYDMTDFLDNEEIRTPLMMYLFHRVESLINGQKICIVIDEFWKALGDEAFLDLVQNKLKTIRKQNGFLVFATQSPQDALQSPIAHTIIEQCPTKVFFPNPEGKADDYMRGYSLSQREFELVKVHMTKENRQFLVKQNRNSIVAELNLSGFDDEIAILSARTETVDLAEEIISHVGSDPSAWMPEFHKQRRSS